MKCGKSYRALLPVLSANTVQFSSEVFFGWKTVLFCVAVVCGGNVGLALRWFYCVRACTDGSNEGIPDSSKVTLQPPLGSRSRQDFQQVPWGKLLSCRLGKQKWNRFKIIISQTTSWRYCILFLVVYAVEASVCAQLMRLLWMCDFSCLLSSASALWSQGRFLLPPEHLGMITEDELGEKGPWGEGWGHGAAEAGEQAGLCQGMPSASQGARGLHSLPAFRKSLSCWSKSKPEGKDTLCWDTREFCPFFHSVFCVILFFWVCFLLKEFVSLLPGLSKTLPGIKKIALGSWVFLKKKM